MSVFGYTSIVIGGDGFRSGCGLRSSQYDRFTRSKLLRYSRKSLSNLICVLIGRLIINENPSKLLAIESRLYALAKAIVSGCRPVVCGLPLAMSSAVTSIIMVDPPLVVVPVTRRTPAGWVIG